MAAYEALNKCGVREGMCHNEGRLCDILTVYDAHTVAVMMIMAHDSCVDPDGDGRVDAGEWL